MNSVQYGLDEVRASYNKTQDPEADKRSILGKIRNDLRNITADPAEEIQRIITVRENLDVVLSVFSDGLGVDVAQTPQPELERQSMVKRRLVEARMLCETAYRRLLKAPDFIGVGGLAALGDLEKINDIWAEVMDDLKELNDIWAEVTDDPRVAAEVQATLEKTAKTGRREAGGDSGSGQIDRRSDALVDVLRVQKFIPHLVVGLPTAGAHVAARIAGALNASEASPEAAVELVTFRPRYVKAFSDTTAVNADLATATRILEQAHRKILAADLSHLELPAQRPLRVLVVDDFSSSGDSIAYSKIAVRETLQSQGVNEIEVRAAVSRYNSAQIHNDLRVHDVNPIDYMAGPIMSGTREEIRRYIDDDDNDGRDAGDRMEAAMRDGLTETGFASPIPIPKPWWQFW